MSDEIKRVGEIERLIAEGQMTAAQVFTQMRQLIPDRSQHCAATAIEHPDDAAVDRFSCAMKQKLAEKRDQGYGGWPECPTEHLQQLLIEHLDKGDPVDVGNFAMMLWNRGDRVAGLNDPAGRVHEAEPVAYLMTHPRKAPMAVTASSSCAEDRESDAILGWSYQPLYAQPPSGKWVRCSEQMPKIGQRVQLFAQGAIQHYMPELSIGLSGFVWDFEEHDCTPLVDYERDQWMPVPQPPQEREGA